MNFRGFAQRAFSWLLGVCLSVLCALPVVRAEPEADALLSEYRAFPGCPERAEFSRRMRARLSDGVGAPGRRFNVSLTRSERGVEGRLTLVGQETSGARTLSAASCDEAVDALALVAALMLRDLSRPASPAASSEPARTQQPKSAPRSQAIGGASEAPGAQASGAASAAALVANETEAISAPEDNALREDRPTQPEREPRRSEPVEPPRAARLLPPELQLFASGLVVSHVAPNVRPGLGLGLVLAFPSRAGPRLNVSLGARATLPDLTRTEQGRAQFVWAAGVSALCIESRPRLVRVAGCAVLELGAVRASGAAETAHAYSRFWGALGPSLGLSFTLHPRVLLGLSGEMLGVLHRDRFFLAEQLVFSVPSLAFRGELALRVTIL